MTAELTAKRLGIGRGHPHFDLLVLLEECRLLTNDWPESSLTLYTLERVILLSKDYIPSHFIRNSIANPEAH